jgi:hypothetical protein
VVRNNRFIWIQWGKKLISGDSVVKNEDLREFSGEKEQI